MLESRRHELIELVAEFPQQFADPEGQEFVEPDAAPEPPPDLLPNLPETYARQGDGECPSGMCSL